MAVHSSTLSTAVKRLEDWWWALGWVNFGVFTAVEEVDLETGLLPCQGREGAWSQSSDCTLSTVPSLALHSPNLHRHPGQTQTQEKA